MVEAEVDESISWMELLIESGAIQAELWEPLWNEANELTAIVVASIRTARRKT